MTQTTPEKPLHLRLPAYRIDYLAGHFASTQSGEITTHLTGVILAYREDRILWPSSNDANPTPLCANGSQFGPCYACEYARWGRDSTPPPCGEELTVLLREMTGTVSTVTARRSMMRAIEQYIGMQELLDQPIFAQTVQLALTPGQQRAENEPALHALRLLPGSYLESGELDRMGELAGRVDRAFRAGELE